MPGILGIRHTRREAIERQLESIVDRVNRHTRGDDSEEMILRDLEFIEGDIKELREMIASNKEEFWL